MSDSSSHSPSALEAAQTAQASAEGIADALQVSELRYRRLFETARDGVLILDSQTGKITNANPYMTELLTYSQDEFLGKELWEIGLLQDKETSQAAFQKLQQERYIRYESLPLETRAGERREVEFVSNLYRENGHTVIQCNIRDITERKTVADALQVSELRYRRLFETARDGILILDSQTCVITDANPYMTELLGYSQDEFLGKELWEIGLLQDKETSQAAFEKLKTQGYIRYEDLPLETRLGEYRAVEFVSNVYPEGEHSVIQCNIRDITQRKHMAEELAAAAHRDQRIAAALQRSMLFTPPEDAFPGLAVKTMYETASDEALVGGDFWDTFAFDSGHVALVIGDVMGHGLKSAIFTAELKYTLRGFVREHEHPGLILTRLNSYLCQTHRLFREGLNDEGDEAPVCLTLVVLHAASGKCVVSAAGMEPPLLLRADGQIEEIRVSGLVLGIEPKEEYKAATFDLGHGDLVLLTTDGITEARRGKEFLGYDGLMRLVQEGRSGTLETLGQTILDGARGFAQGKLLDDACLLLARRQ